jgi:hypothetical protein
VIEVITVRGQGEPYRGVRNMLSGVTAQLDPSKFRVLDDAFYPASIGLINQTWNVVGPSEDESVQQGMDGLAQLIRGAPDKVGVLGYSLGAEVVTRFLEAQVAGQYSDCELAFTACVANPLRRVGDSIDPRVPGFGINGQMQIQPPHPHFEAANPGDVITSCDADSPLRTLASAVSAFGLAQIGGWAGDMADRLRYRRFQPVSFRWWQHPIVTWDLFEEAAQGVEGYLTGEHNLVYQEQGYLSRLARVINTL